MNDKDSVDTANAVVASRTWQFTTSKVSRKLKRKLKVLFDELRSYLLRSWYDLGTLNSEDLARLITT